MQVRLGFCRTGSGWLWLRLDEHRARVWCAESSEMRTPVEMASTEQTSAEPQPAMVTSYNELRASLAERKNFRRAKKIDDRLPEASAALGDAPRRKQFAQTEEGRREWQNSGIRYRRL